MSRTTELHPTTSNRLIAGRGTDRGSGWASLRRTALHALGWPARVHRARRLMHQLGQLGDHELRDIGLTRLDLQAASALPLDADPSLLLRRRADGSRRRP